ncbi:MAG: D-alanyl-D-alanine carboxypeptidase/D-alanyl-D-alanine-endopeptidase [Deltaproteobacteria bacterium]|nr:D-alanyl-D-alanine carboxypeptidase/D-alanyl-D-alanine-endopeptidase [Deltaproteobacteria bacterium]
MKARTTLAAIILASASGVALAKPAPAAKAGKRDPKKLGANALVAWRQSGGGKPGRGAATAEEQTATQIQKLLRGPLREGQTGLFVVDARTGDALFSVNAEDPLNPASNVKMISTATAMELLGPSFRYPTRLLGAAPDEAGVVRGDVYLLGSHDPTLTAAHLDDLGRSLAARGITAIEGDVVVGTDATREAIFRGIVPVTITAGDPGKPPIATVTSAPSGGFDLVTLKVTATTSRYVHRPLLTYRTETVKDPKGRTRIVLTIGGAIGRGDRAEYKLATTERTAAAAYGVIASLRTYGVAFGGDVKTMELGDFVGDSVAAGGLPVELARHESATIASIVADINKWSINWLADRLVMTAAALTRRRPPSMELAVDAMYGWLARHPHVDRAGVVLDTGSGLSYRTRISAHELVDVVRAAGGFAGDTDPDTSSAWLRSLSVGGHDGTLRYRFQAGDVRGRIHGKTGTLSNVIALSGILDVDPARPLAFSLVTNSDAPLSWDGTRKAHDLVVGELCRYLAKTAKAPLAPPAVELTAVPAAVKHDEPDAE